MSSGTPYIGSKISLVSKAEIRYEGFLYTIDQNDSTVTLAKVISLGTEDRVPDNPVPAREEVFEYIVFRGSDIKDLHVCEGPKRVEDPAIVHQSSHSYSQPNNPYHNNNRNYAPFGPGGGMPNFGYYPFNFHQNGPGGDAPSSRQPPPSLPRTPTPEPPKQTARDRDSGSQQYRDNRDNSGQYNRDRDGGTQHRDRDVGQHRGGGQPQNKSQTTNYEDRKRNNDRDTGSRDTNTKENRDAKDESVKDNRDKRNVNREPKENRDYRDNRGTRDQDNREYRDNRYNRDNRDNRDNRYRQNYVRKENSNPDEKDEQRFSAPRGRGQSRGGRGGRGYVGGRGEGRGRGGTPRGGGNTRTKFTEDFDFETANAKFNKEEIEKELLKVLKKVKIKDDDGEGTELKDSKDENEKESDERAPLPSPDKFYDRSKSFFDNIRCEAMVPKSEDEIMTRRQEQALNAETFGSSASHYRPGFRGRGRGRGRWRGRGRGRGRGSYRGNSNRPWVDYEFDYDAAGMKNRHQPMKVSTERT